MREPLVKEINAGTAEAFFDLLTPHRGGELWDRIDNGRWIFRGQREAAWGLTPKAIRRGNPWFWAGLEGPAMIELPVVDEQERIQREIDSVVRFAIEVSDHGYEIPWDSAELRDPDFRVDLSGKNFPDPRYRGAFALAQHYGVPTRLLDWSTRPLVDAYFAATDAAKRQRATAKPAVELGVAKANAVAALARSTAPDLSDAREAVTTLLSAIEYAERQATAETDRLAVWAVNMNFLRLLQEDDPGVIMVSVPTTSNPNLRSQAGLFTLVRYLTEAKCTKAPPDLDVLLRDPALERRRDDTAGIPMLPMLFKLTMPAKEAPELLHYLSLSEIDAAAIFHGHASIVEAMGEDRLRKVVTRATRVGWGAVPKPGP